MLAKAGDAPARRATRWAFEVKWDGIRALVLLRARPAAAGDAQPARRHRRVSRAARGSTAR